jgi:hypothetical protein
VGADLSLADLQTDMTKLMALFAILRKAPKTEHYIIDNVFFLYSGERVARLSVS